MLKVKRTTADFYPRSPCGERLYANFDGFYWWVISIHALLAESDLFLCCNAAKPRHFYPRSPCGERHRAARADRQRKRFLSTLSLRRATSLTPKLRLPPKDFYPRSPCGERRQRDLFQFPDTGISIHALLAESDPVLLFPQIPVFDFYPRSPCGERPYILPFVAHLLFQFLSTLSLRRATRYFAKALP